MEEEKEGGQPGLEQAHYLSGALSGFSLETAECFENTSMALTTSAATTWLRSGGPWVPLPVLRVSRGQTPGDIAHLEGDVLPISVEGARL